MIADLKAYPNPTKYGLMLGLGLDHMAAAPFAHRSYQAGEVFGCLEKAT
ncbi:MAG: hypothetical protein HY911_09900 [Desulfobacterales bacterium]|nr:hypothetical protein [Desulfobacterales bacterium]